MLKFPHKLRFPELKKKKRSHTGNWGLQKKGMHAPGLFPGGCKLICAH